MIEFHLQHNGELLAQADEQQTTGSAEQPQPHPETREADLSDPLAWAILGGLTVAACFSVRLNSRIRNRHQSQ